MKKRRSSLAPVFFSRTRQLIFESKCAVRGWPEQAARRLSLVVDLIRESWTDRHSKVDSVRLWLWQQPGTIRCHMLEIAGRACHWSSEAWDWMSQDLLRAERRLRALSSRIGEAPSSVKNLPYVLIEFYAGGRPERAAVVKVWLVKQTGASRVLLQEFKDEARIWGLEARNWVRQDAELVNRRLIGLMSAARDWRTGKLQVDWRRLVTRPVVVAALAGFILIGGNLLLTQNRLVYAVIYNGQELGMVASRQVGDEIRLQVQQQLERKVGKSVWLPAAFNYRTSMAPRTLLSVPNELSEKFQNLPWVTDGELISVNHKPVIALADKDVARELLDQVKIYYLQKYPGEKVQDVRFNDDVTVLKQQVPVSQVVSADTALALLKQGQARQDRYTVKNGDSLWSIARSHNLLVSDLLKANPQLAPGSLHKGDKLQMSTAQPLISVLVISTQVVKEPIPRDIQVQSDANLWRGQTNVLKPGADGVAEVSYQIERVNDQTLKRDVLTRKVLSQPQPRLVAEGMRRTVAYAGGASRGSGSGTLSWPISGIITSPFGYRGGEFHTGIDICASYGTPVRVAASGTVTMAGWDGGYGNCIIVDHGDGLATRYAHLSRIDVSIGERVSRGEVIGNLGATGRATGPHLHFEVISNGTVASPLRFLH